MQWVFLFVVALIEKIALYVIKNKIAGIGIYIVYITTTIALFFAFIAAIYAALNGLLFFAPTGVGFGLSLLPNTTPAYIAAYLSALIAKRTFDWYHEFASGFAKTLAESAK